MAETKSKIDFKATVKDRKPVSIVMEVSIDSSVIDQEMKKVFYQIQQQARVDGFRQGKAPLNIIKDKYADEAKSQMVENVVRATVFDALDNEKFDAIEVPILDEFDYKLGQDMKYSFTAQCHPKIEAKDYKSIVVNKDVFKVTDKSLAQSIDLIRESNAKIVPSESGIVNDKSLVSVDYEGFDEKGQPIKEISAKSFLIDLAAEHTLKEFKDNLKGLKSEDKKDIAITYPSDYVNKLIAGKTVTFKTKVIEVKERQLPKLDDDFAKDMGLLNLEELNAKVKQSIEAEEKRRQENDVEKQIIDALIKKNNFDIPDCLVKQQEERLRARLSNYMQRQGIGQEHINEEIEKSKEKFNTEAQRSVRLSYILNDIYEKENLQVTDAELDEEKTKMAATASGKESEAQKYFNEHKDQIINSIKETKIFKFLTDNAKIKESIKDMPLKKENK